MRTQECTASDTYRKPFVDEQVKGLCGAQLPNEWSGARVMMLYKQLFLFRCTTHSIMHPIVVKSTVQCSPDDCDNHPGSA